MDEVFADLWFTTQDEVDTHAASDARQLSAIKFFRRQILAEYLSRGADDFSFEKIDGECGRPEHVPSGEHCPLWIDMAQAEDLIVVGVSNCRVGVDLKPLNFVEYFDDRELDRFFTADEILEIQLAEDDERDLTLLRLWTKKVAFLKATGKKVRLKPPANRISVSSAVPGGKITHPAPSDQACGPEFCSPKCGIASENPALHVPSFATMYSDNFCHPRDWCATSELIGDGVLGLATRSPVAITIRNLPASLCHTMQQRG